MYNAESAGCNIRRSRCAECGSAYDTLTAGARMFDKEGCTLASPAL